VDSWQPTDLNAVRHAAGSEHVRPHSTNAWDLRSVRRYVDDKEATELDVILVVLSCFAQHVRRIAPEFARALLAGKDLVLAVCDDQKWLSGGLALVGEREASVEPCEVVNLLSSVCIVAAERGGETDKVESLANYLRALVDDADAFQAAIAHALISCGKQREAARMLRNWVVEAPYDSDSSAICLAVALKEMGDDAWQAFAQRLSKSGSSLLVREVAGTLLMQSRY
jgi:Bacterial type III secretion protein (HrpB1_HrpK)